MIDICREGLTKTFGVSPWSGEAVLTLLGKLKKLVIVEVTAADNWLPESAWFAKHAAHV